MNIFERATREKTRFCFKGLVSVEELWDLSLEYLDSLWCELESELEKLPKKSLLSTNTKQRDEIEFKQEIIKHIVETKKAEKLANEQAKANASKKQTVLDMIASKQNDDLKNMSIEELKKLAESL